MATKEEQERFYAKVIQLPHAEGARLIRSYVLRQNLTPEVLANMSRDTIPEFSRLGVDAYIREATKIGAWHRDITGDDAALEEFLRTNLLED